MKFKLFFFLVFAVGLVLAETEEPEKKKTTTARTTTTVPTTPSTPSTTPTMPTTTPSPSPTTTPSPLSTTPSPSSTTPSPSSTTPSPLSTTPSPSPPTTTPTTPPPSTTTPTPSPHPSPTPTPAPKEYFWNVTDDHGRNCILAKADISLELKYTDKSKHETHHTFTIPKNATASGKCGNDTQILTISFNASNTFDFVFARTDDKEGFHVSSINSTVVVEDKIVIHLGFAGLNAFKTKFNTSYDCPWSEPATLEQNDRDLNNTKATLRVVLHNIHVEAFRNTTDNEEFSKTYSCANDSPDIVPIMVGIALGILVIVVLIAYLVGRRNTQAQGYLSM